MAIKNRKIILGTIGITMAATVAITLAIFNNIGKKNYEMRGFVDENGNKQSNNVVIVPPTTEIDPNNPDTIPTPEIPNSDLPGGNCTSGLGKLMLINANYTVDENFIVARRAQLVDITELYGITEANSWNGPPLLDKEAAIHLNDMIRAYEEAYPGHIMQTMSCFRSIGTSCGRLCAATGTSEHHSGYTCDLADTYYGATLDTDYYDSHKEWQWLKANSYKYGFIDRYPEEWAGGSMYEPINLDEIGSTGYYETWHYRYVGVTEATEIATGKYNNGKYDSLEHYLKQRKFLNDLRAGTCNK
ncbi:M15 family metallopeptidase [Candidatus Saccharibacteria bacterium]|nr:M15 family metallopeptidase [Candidatus Saccharibacteria bacterium]